MNEAFSFFLFFPFFFFFFLSVFACKVWQGVVQRDLKEFQTVSLLQNFMSDS